MCSRSMALFFDLRAFGVVAAPERVLAIRFKRAPFLRPFFATDVVWYSGSVAVALALPPAGPGPRALRQLS